MPNGHLEQGKSFTVIDSLKNNAVETENPNLIMLLILKLFSSPALIAFASVAGRIWGSTVSGALIALPIIAGPIIYIIILEQGLDFGIKTAAGSLTGIVSFAVFSLSYTFLSKNYRVLITTLLSWSAVLLTIYLLQAIKLELSESFVLTTLVLLITLKVLPKINHKIIESKPPTWEIAIRIFAAGILVMLVTGIAEKAGPNLSGLLATFPIASSVLAIFSHKYHGHESIIRTSRGFISGLFGFAVFFLIIATGLPIFGLNLTFIFASAVVIVIHFLTIVVIKKQH